MRLRIELRERCIADSLIDDCIGNLEVDWVDLLNSVRVKKFGSALPADYTAQGKELRFLQYRGFTSEQIKWLYKSDD